MYIYRVGDFFFETPHPDSYFDPGNQEFCLTARQVTNPALARLYEEAKSEAALIFEKDSFTSIIKN